MGVSRHRIHESCVGLPLTRGLLKAMPYANGAFDVVSSVECIEHIPIEDLLATLVEIRRIVKTLFIFTLGPCSEDCNGFCSWSAIHPSGLCAARPRQWWHQLMLQAGFRRLEQPAYDAVLHSLGVRSDECETKEGSQAADCKSFNPEGHRYFIYSPMGTQGGTAGGYGKSSDL